MNLIWGSLEGGAAKMRREGFHQSVSSGWSGEGRRLIYGIRPENLVLEGGASVDGRVFDIEGHGVIKILAIEVGGAKLRATISAQMKMKLDEVVRFGWKPDKVLLFDADRGTIWRWPELPSSRIRSGAGSSCRKSRAKGGQGRGIHEVLPGGARPG